MHKRTQDLIFTLYGDYIRQRGGEAWVGSLILLLGCLGASEQAVRSALSRLVRKGWLTTRRESRRSYYSVTEKATTMMEEAERRIFSPRHDSWDGQWHILTYSIPAELGNKRDNLRAHLRWLGFGRLAPGTWVSPRDLYADLATYLEAQRLTEYVEWFSGAYAGFGDLRQLEAQLGSRKAQRGIC